MTTARVLFLFLPGKPVRRERRSVATEHISDPLERLIASLTVETFPGLKDQVRCRKCGKVGQIELFQHPENNGTGMRCTACGFNHPLSPRVWWLRSGKKQPSSKGTKRLVAHLGAYCYGCGLSERVLKDLGIGFPHLHHTRPMVRYGDGVEKIPVCRLCHELLSAAQRDRWALFAERMEAADAIEAQVAELASGSQKRRSSLLGQSSREGSAAS